jgi:hypothetical protein
MAAAMPSPSVRAGGVIAAVVLAGCPARVGPGPSGSTVPPMVDGAAAAVDGALPVDRAQSAGVVPDGPAAVVDLAAEPSGDQGGGTSCVPCAGWSEPRSGSFDSNTLDAISGMAASWRNRGILYVHNDGDDPVFYALTEAGDLRGTFTIRDASPIDLEDMAVGPCAAGEPARAESSCIYLADVGNNREPRTEFSLYRGREPVVSLTGPPVSASLGAQRFTFSYVDGPHNAESLVVDPGGGDIFIITKEEAGEPSAAYRLETFEPGVLNRAVKVALLPVPARDDQPATAAAAHPCGTGFLLRTSTRLYEFRIAPGVPLVEAFRVAPVVVPSGAEFQSEAVTYRPDGRAYFTTGEQTPTALHRSDCASAP